MTEVASTVNIQPELEELLWAAAGSDFSAVVAEYDDLPAHDPQARAALYGRALSALAFAETVGLAELPDHIRHRRVVNALLRGQLPSTAIPANRFSSERPSDDDLALAAGYYLRLAISHPDAPSPQPAEAAFATETEKDSVDEEPADDSPQPDDEAETPPEHRISDRLNDGLISLAVQGDRGALTRVMEEIHPLVVQYCRARLGRARHSGTADDVAQEVCLAVLNALPNFTIQGRPFLAFVYGIAGHKVIDAYRAATRDRLVPVETLPEIYDTNPGPEDRVLDTEFGRHAAELLAGLTDRQRDALILRIMSGFSAEEAAGILGSTPGAVRITQHRALKRLRERLGRLPAGDLLNTL